jgi:hypothetical protein
VLDGMLAYVPYARHKGKPEMPASPPSGESRRHCCADVVTFCRRLPPLGRFNPQQGIVHRLNTVVIHLVIVDVATMDGFKGVPRRGSEWPANADRWAEMPRVEDAIRGPAECALA